MDSHHTHGGHDHVHGAGCGHATIRHEGHTDYLHDGHMHHVHGNHVDEHALPVGGANEAACTPAHACGGHDPRRRSPQTPRALTISYYSKSWSPILTVTCCGGLKRSGRASKSR